LRDLFSARSAELNSCQVPPTAKFLSISNAFNHLQRFTAVGHSPPKFAILKIEMGDAEHSGLAHLFFLNPARFPDSYTLPMSLFLKTLVSNSFRYIDLGD
jgi:hypothetical protein